MIQWSEDKAGEYFGPDESVRGARTTSRYAAEPLRRVCLLFGGSFFLSKYRIYFGLIFCDK